MSETTKEQCHVYLQTVFYVFIVRNAKIRIINNILFIVFVKHTCTYMQIGLS